MTDLTLHALKRFIEDDLNALRSWKLSDEQMIELCERVVDSCKRLKKKVK